MSMDNPALRLAERGYDLLVRGGELLQHLVLLVFRLHWGLEFMHTGWGKFNNHAKVTEFFTGLGIPLPGLNAWFVAGVECVGGLLLFLGLATRPVGVLLTGTMTVAYLSVADDRAKLFNMFQDPDAFLSADPFFFLLTAVLVLSFGPGAFSVDYLLKRFLFKREMTGSDTAAD